MVFVLNIGIVLSFFLGILLFSKKDKVLTDNILSLWLFVIGIHLTGYFLNYKGYWDIYPHLIGVTAPFPLLYGPFLYLYVQYSLKSKKHIQKRDYIHFAPALVSYLFMMPFYFTYSAEEKIQVDKGLINDYSIFSSILLISFIISGITYAILAYRMLLKRHKIVEDNYSYSNRIDMNWLRFAIIGIGLVFITAAVVITFREMLGFKFPFNADILFYSIIVSFVVFIGYSGIRQQDLFSNTIKNEDDLIQMENEYKKPGLNQEIAIKKHRELLELMENEKPYLNASLTIFDLSKEMDMNVRELSILINHNLNQHFFDFVNEYRIQKAMEILQNPDKKKLTILEILYDVGFNSKSSFNTAFKKYTQQTPTEFRQKALKKKVKR